MIADRVNPKRFYALDLSAAVLYESMDGGVSFRSRRLPFAPFDSKARNARGDRRGGQDRVYATPGKEGDLWIAAFDGLYHGLPGEAFVPLDKVRRIYAFGFGKAAPGSDYPSLYLAGIVNGISGFFVPTMRPVAGYVSMMMTTNTDWCCTSLEIRKDTGEYTSVRMDAELFMPTLISYISDR